MKKHNKSCMMDRKTTHAVRKKSQHISTNVNTADIPINPDSCQALPRQRSQHHDWQRCSEGFDFVKSESPLGPSSNHWVIQSFSNRRDSNLVEESVTHKYTYGLIPECENDNTRKSFGNVDNTRQSFGSVWIQSELAQQSKPHEKRTINKVSALKSILVPSYSVSTLTTADTDDEPIQWSNSDSDSEKKEAISSLGDAKLDSLAAGRAKDFASQLSGNISWHCHLKDMPNSLQKTSCQPALQARPSLKRSRQSITGCSKRKSFDDKVCKYRCGTSFSADGDISPPESDDGISSDIKDLVSTQRESHLMQIESLGSPERQNCLLDYEINDQEEVTVQTTSSSIESGKAVADLPSISSCTSNADSQVSHDSNASPPGGGIRASEWARQVYLEASPSKQQTSSPPVFLDSAKKKKKRCIKGGLSEQMSRLVQRENSALHMWQHQLRAENNSQDSPCMIIQVQNVEVAFSLQLANCIVVSSTLPTSFSYGNSQISILFSPHSSYPKAAMQKGAIIRVYPPWQHLEIRDSVKVLMCTRYFFEESSVLFETGQDHLVAADSTYSESVNGRWKCPCSDGLVTASRCPAQLFPFMPSLVMQPQVTTDHKSGHTGRTLQTVTSTSSTQMFSPRTLVFDTLLESIEKTRAGDPVLPRFQARVLRVYQQRTGGVARSSVLVEDSQGTVALISAPDTVGNVEGQLCCFSGLRVYSRTNADRDPNLFSAIASAWLVKSCNPLASQESDKSVHCGDSFTMPQIVQPPGFCYLLQVDSPWAGAASGETWINTESPSSEDQPPVLVLTTIAEALQMQQQSSRLSVLGRMLYQHGNLCDNTGDKSSIDSASLPLELFICDHSLQQADSCKSKFHFCSLQSLDAGIKSTDTTTVNMAPRFSAESATSCVPHRHCQADSVRVPPSPPNLSTLCDKQQHGPQTLPSYVKVCVDPECIVLGLTWGATCSHLKQELPLQTLLLRDVWLHHGVWTVDKYSTVTVLSGATESTESRVGRLDQNTVDQINGCVPCLPTISTETRPHSLVSFSGIIKAVDEKSAFSWEECNSCGSDKLVLKSSTSDSKSNYLYCLSCEKAVTSPRQKMNMDVTMSCDACPAMLVNISLQQDTIENLLPSQQDEDYDVDCILGKQVGPINCFISKISSSTSRKLLYGLQLPF